jgi:hypothetical protein
VPILLLIDKLLMEAPVEEPGAEVLQVRPEIHPDLIPQCMRPADKKGNTSAEDDCTVQPAAATYRQKA